MDAAPLREFSDGCEDCNRIASATEEAVAAGQDYEGGEMTVNEVGRPLVKDNTVEIPLRVNQARFIVRDAAGTPTNDGIEEFENVLGAAALNWDSGRSTWLMTQLTFG